MSDSILTGEKILITLNDSLNFSPKSNDEGIRYIPSTPGKCRIKVNYPNYKEFESWDIWIGIGKTVELKFALIPDRPLTKKEKKKLHIK